MNLSDLKTIDDVIREHCSQDPVFAAEWDRGGFAREISVAVIRYRAERGMSQRDLASAVGVTESVVDRLELGEPAALLSVLGSASPR